MLNEHGQLLNRRFNSKRLDDRKVDQLIGLCEGVLADGVVTLQEAQFLQSWLNVNASIRDRWPANVVFARLEEFLADGELSEQQEGELLALLMDVAGIHTGEGKATGFLPLCDPPPDISFEGKVFVLTGKFAAGTRAECEYSIIERGGLVSRNVSKSTEYVVIGTLVSEHWAHESYGRKIEKAVELRESGGKPSIISEEHWARWVARVT